MNSARLADLIEYSRDGEWGKSDPAPGHTKLRVVRGTDFDAFRVGDLSRVPVRFVEDRKAAAKRLITGDILIETAGGTADRPTGRTVLVRERHLEQGDSPLTCASFARFIRIDPEKADPAYIYLWLDNAWKSRELMRWHVQHTGVARFHWTKCAESLHIPLPDRSTQQRIAEPILVLDDLIENNRRRVKVLEEMARAIYREWFVHFRFPGHDNMQMIDSRSEASPAGWNVSTVKDLSAVLTRGIAPKYADDGEWIVLNQKCIRDERVSLAPSRRQSRAVADTKRVTYGDVLINSTGVGTLGRVAMYRGDDSQLTVDSHVTIARPNDRELNPWFGLSLMAMKPDFERFGSGSTGQTELSRADVGAQTLVLPPSELLARFAGLTWPMLSEADSLIAEGEMLAAMRDLLLPKLVTGQIDVSALDLDAFVEGAVA